MVVAEIGGLLLFALIGFIVRAPGASLASRFAQLGDLKGKNVLDIIAAVGNPQAETQLANGTRLVQWQATGFRIALLFAGDECLDITHQSRS
jgi:hypothetical protein